MKKTLGTIAGIVLIALSGSALADEQMEIGQKIYERAFGRGCGTCHDIASNPQLPALIKAGTLDRAKFEQVLREGKGGMPKAVDEIMKNKAVEKAGLTEELAIDDLYKYIEQQIKITKVKHKKAAPIYDWGGFFMSENKISEQSQTLFLTQITNDGFFIGQPVMIFKPDTRHSRQH